ncbi:hypothetical protein HZH68_012359 [Vespula germanica]|uniref:C2H2-type domain-containing protein n=1 Tax=Vespula germanica TaxID=30212 RepID=A0A834JIB9_VESGE|nr:hypothetical protein HZH68_012359 [Vespula germanica]
MEYVIHHQLQLTSCNVLNSVSEFCECKKFDHPLLPPLPPLPPPLPPPPPPPPPPPIKSLGYFCSIFAKRFISSYVIEKSKKQNEIYQLLNQSYKGYVKHIRLRIPVLRAEFILNLDITNTTYFRKKEEKKEEKEEEKEEEEEEKEEKEEEQEQEEKEEVEEEEKEEKNTSCSGCGLIMESMDNVDHVDSFFTSLSWSGETIVTRRISSRNNDNVPAPLTPQRRARLHCPIRHPGRNNRPLGSIQTSGHDRRHNCSRCGKSYKNAYILKRHLLYECGKAPSFSCPHCPFSSKYERNLKAHINHRHMDVIQSAQSAATALNQRA